MLLLARVVMNSGSLSRLLAAVAFTVTLSASLVVRAERVLVADAEGAAPADRLDDVGEALLATVRALGHDAVAWTPAQPRPETAEAMAAAARDQSAAYVLYARVGTGSDRYRLSLRVGYAPRVRVEDLEIEVVVSDQTARLRDALGAMLRPEGLGADALRLSGVQLDPAADEAARRAAEERARLEAEERARREAEERARREREEAERRAFLEREAARRAEARRQELVEWEGRDRYGSGERRWLGQLGLDARSLIAYDSARDGGFLMSLSLRGGRALTNEIELRGALDIVWGAASGFALTGGAAYLASFFREPIYIGGALETGLLQTVTGAQSTSLVVRGGPVVSWRAGPRFFVEGALPELTALGAGGGALTLGMSVRAGLRF